MAIKILIVEDEPLTAERLARLLKIVIPDGQVVAMLDSVKSTINWITSNQTPDLAFFDIQLADGISFEIFEQTRVAFPVIFTTAFNEYALKAFKVNSIDYLLKPIKQDELEAAVRKFREGFYSHPASIEIESIAATLNQLTNSYKTRFLVKVGEHLKMIAVTEIAMFYSMDKAVFVKTVTGGDYALDFTLEQVNRLIDPAKFFRISRSHIVAIDCISDVIAYSGSRYKIKLNVKTDTEIIVAREKVQAFKAWLEG